MKRYGMAVIDWAYIGAQLAIEDADTQAQFFNSFAKEVFSWGKTLHQRNMQMLEIQVRLSNQAKSLIDSMEYHENEKRERTHTNWEAFL